MLKSNSKKYMMIVVVLSFWLFGFLPIMGQEYTDSLYNKVYTYIPTLQPDTIRTEFRGDTLVVIEDCSFNMSIQAAITLAHLDYFGLEYWDILLKHKIYFDDRIHKQLKRIFDNERLLGKNSK